MSTTICLRLLSIGFPFQTRLIRVTGPREADPCLRNFVLRAIATGPPPVAIFKWGSPTLEGKGYILPFAI